MAKKLQIEIIDEEEVLLCDLHSEYKLGPFLQMHDIFNIFSKVTNGESTYKDSFDYAIDRLILCMCARSINRITVNIDERDELYYLNTPREMTLDQIEKELGYKVKIIEQEKN